MNSGDLRGVINVDTLNGQLENMSPITGTLVTENMRGTLNIDSVNSTMENVENLLGSMTGSQADRGITNIYLNDIEQDVSGKVAYLRATYSMLEDKPKINNIELKNNKSFEDLGADALTNTEIENLINSIV